MGQKQKAENLGFREKRCLDTWGIAAVRISCNIACVVKQKKKVFETEHVPESYGKEKKCNGQDRFLRYELFENIKNEKGRTRSIYIEKRKRKSKIKITEKKGNKEEIQ